MPIPEPHPPHEPIQTWRSFFIHIATVTIGLLIAIALEQCVESLHHLHQRHQLQEDLLEEARRNRDILRTDLALDVEGQWFRAVLAATKSIPASAAAAIDLPPMPCIPGTLGANGTDAAVRTKYFMPSEAVWSTARDAGLIMRLPVSEARMYSRLAHNYALQQAARDRFAAACDAIDSMHTRYASVGDDKAHETWLLGREQAEALAGAAATADTALRGLMWRVAWNLRFEDGILRGAKNYDDVLMNLTSQGP